MNWIVQDLNHVSDFFYDIYIEVLDWVWPFWLAAEFFLDLSYGFNDLAWDFYDFAGWVSDVWDMVLDILSWSAIRGLIRDWLDGIEGMVDWFQDWALRIGQEIEDWWLSTLATVQGWIDFATQGFDEMVAAWTDFWLTLWPDILSAVGTLQSYWNDFWANIYPNLVSFAWLTTWWTSTMGEVVSLIDTAFILRESLWAGWQDVRDAVFEFFTDPWAWLEKKFTDWFLGPEV